MKEEIANNIDNPRQLEKLYRDNKSIFKKEFNLMYPEIMEKQTARFWNERLNFEGDEISWGSRPDLGFVIVASFFAGLIAKFPDWSGINEEFFYSRNISFIVFPFLTAWFAFKQGIQIKRLILVLVSFLVSAVYINVLPIAANSDTLTLACIHLPLFLWAILGITFAGNEIKNYQRRIDFLRYNGDLVVMTGLILIAGALLSGITIGLFELIGLKIEEIYFKYVGIWGLAASPIVATYLVRTNPQLVNKVSPVIAKVFTPLVFVMLVIYLIAVIYTGKDPYNDREFLLIFNLLLIGIMAIIFFSIAESSKSSGSKIETVLLLCLSIVTILVNSIALSAILFRISEWGITPNRLAVLGGNFLILTNLLMVTYRLFRTVRNRNEIDGISKTIAVFLPVYLVWTMLVIYLFPILFQFK